MIGVPSEPPIRCVADQLALDSGKYIWKPEVELLPYIRFAQTYCLLDADWNHQPMQLLDYQIADLIGPMLGWVEPDTGILRTTESLIYSPKKIGKSMLMASLLAYWATTKKGQNCRLMASTVDQANTIFSMLVGFTNHPDLQERWHIQDGRKTITDKVTKSTIKVMACRPTGVSGPKIHLLIMDEMAEIAPFAARKVWDRVKFAGAANTGGRLICVITTPAHECDTLGYELWTRARSILSGDITDDLRTHACVYGAEPEDNWELEETWKKAGPHIGQLVPLSFYEEEYRKAKGNPEDEMGYRIYLLGQYLRNKRMFIDMAKWHTCATEFPDLKGRRACIGFDNGGASDILGYTILVPHDGKIYAIPKGIISQACLDRKTKVGQTQYEAWRKKGLLTVEPGETVQYPQLMRHLDKEYEDYDIAALAYDPWQIKELKEDFARKNRLLIETPQYGKYMCPLILELERRISEQTLLHPGHPVLDFCVENLRVTEDKYGRLQCDKESARHKIDLAVSTIIALNALPEVIKPQWKLPSVLSM